MPELPEDDIQRMPDADRIRNRIRERREAEQTEQTTSGAKYDVPGDDPTSTNLKWENVVDGGDSTAMKLDDIETLDPNDPDSWKVEEVKTADFANGDDPAVELDSVVDHKADDLAMKLDRPDAVVDHKADDLAMKLDRPDTVVDHKADDLAMKLDQPTTGFEEIEVTFDDPITQTGLVDAATPHLDKASPKGLPVDESGDSAYEGTVATGGVTDSGSDDDHTDGVFKFAVPTDQPGDGDSFKSVSGMEVAAEPIVPTGETAMQQPPVDPVGDALAPLDGGDELVDPAADSADLTAQIDGLHDDDDGLDDSFGA